jgi:hypothetical protein
MSGLPDGVLLAFYGDDFTGSTDTMEVLAFAGIETVLFLDDPTPDRLALFPEARAVGIAGVSRGRDPAWMEAELPGRFAALSRLRAPILQYKVCSTFDSSPGLGSIGKAIDLGVRHAAGSPGRRSWSARRGFAASRPSATCSRRWRGGPPARPAPHHGAASRDPDGRGGSALHLRRQTARRIELIDFVALKSGDGDARLTSVRAPTCRPCSSTSWTTRPWRRRAASSGRTGVRACSPRPRPASEYALVAHWRRAS